MDGHLTFQTWRDTTAGNPRHNGRELVFYSTPDRSRTPLGFPEENLTQRVRVVQQVVQSGNLRAHPTPTCKRSSNGGLACLMRSRQTSWRWLKLPRSAPNILRKGSPWLTLLESAEAYRRRGRNGSTLLTGPTLPVAVSSKRSETARMTKRWNCSVTLPAKPWTDGRGSSASHFPTMLSLNSLLMDWCTSGSLVL